MTTSHPKTSPLARGTHHLYLFSKGHYQQTNLLSDLQIIVAQRAGIDPRHIRTSDILGLLVEEVADVWLRTPRAPHRIGDFLSSLRVAILQQLPHGSMEEIDLLFIRQCLNVLAATKIREGSHLLLDIGHPDPTVLPFASNRTPSNIA